MSANTLSTLTDFLKLRKQSVVINAQLCTWSSFEAGVTQEPILGPSLFLIYINDLSDDLTTKARVFSDVVLCFYLVNNMEDFCQ